MEDGNWTVLVVNCDYFDTDFSINFEEAIGKNFYRHSYNPNTVKATASATVPGVDKTYRNVSKTIQDTLGGGMIAVYTTKKD